MLVLLDVAPPPRLLHVQGIPPATRHLEAPVSNTLCSGIMIGNIFFGGGTIAK